MLPESLYFCSRVGKEVVHHLSSGGNEHLNFAPLLPKNLSHISMQARLEQNGRAVLYFYSLILGAK